ncbi:MAG: O-antigen ligase family protein [bacterium]|nr:O-antigen ligase family protein [bacterium]
MQRALREIIRYAGAPALVAGALAILLPSSPFFGVLTLVVLVVAFAARPMLGWSLVVLAYPFIYLQLFIGEEINIPYVDLFAMLTFVGVALRFVIERYRNDQKQVFQIPDSRFQIPGIAPFLLFILAAALSLMNVEHLALGVKYLLRPLTFFYLMFIVLPVIVVNTPRRLFTTFRLLFIVGIAAAAMGVWSLLFPSEPGVFRRAVPIAIFGTTPLGTNHNLIAEVLVSVIPIGIVLAAFAHERLRRWYVVGTVVLALVTLLTFSRNGWLTLAVEGTVLLVAVARDRGMSWRRMTTFAAPAIAIAVLAVGVFSMSAIARSSNINRIRLTEIALEQFQEHPIIGAGVGTFIEAVSRDRWYVGDFGRPQEAHGLIQKLLAETGALGLITFVALLASIIGYIVRVYRMSAIAEHWRLILLALGCSAFGSIVFQLFNTSYFVSKLWLPLGIALAAARLAERGIALRREDSGLQQ